jgi:hypothetical protein
MPPANLVEQYRKHHFVGRDCRLTCLRNVLDYFGVKESYATTFGMSSCFHFGYRKEKFTYPERLEAPYCDLSDYYYPILGQRLNCMENLADTYHATFMGNYPDEAHGSFDRIRELVGNGIPVMAAVSRAMLCEYTGRPAHAFEFLPGVDFGGHWVVVAGVDDDAETVTLFDADLEKPIIVPLKLFQDARSAGDGQDSCFIQSRNRWAVFIRFAITIPWIFMRKAV